ncbi:hypothetical protein CR513_49554, partial [Mucuna pruriens]
MAATCKIVYEEALARHEERFKAEKERFNINHNMEKLKKWKMALLGLKFMSIRVLKFDKCKCSTQIPNELHKAGKTKFYLPGERIPDWFDHQRSGPSISFRFWNKFPKKVLCLVIRPMDDDYGIVCYVHVALTSDEEAGP